jgi:hypothetical protein
MSRFLILVCEQCNKSLWVGQARYIYTQPPSQMKAFNEFMCTHFGHPLRLVDHNYDWILDKCEGVTPRSEQ